MAALNTVYVLLAIAVVCCQSATLNNNFITQAGKDEKNDINIQLQIEQDSKLYHKGSGGRFEYGLDVPQPERDQYQHKEHRVDDVTYGCFGHVDPDGGEHNTFYIAGSFGYRPLLQDGKKLSYPDIDENLHWKNFPEDCTTYFNVTEGSIIADTTTPPRPPPTNPPPTTPTPQTPDPTTPKIETTPETPGPRPTPSTTTTSTTPRTTRARQITDTTTTTTTPAPPKPTTRTPDPTTRAPDPTTPTTSTSTTTTTTTRKPPPTTTSTEQPGRDLTTTQTPPTNCISEDAAKQIESVIDMLQNLLNSPRCTDKCGSGRSGDDSTPEHVLLPLVLVDKLHGKSGFPVGSKFAIPSVSHEQTKNV